MNSTPVLLMEYCILVLKTCSWTNILIHTMLGIAISTPTNFTSLELLVLISFFWKYQLLIPYQMTSLISYFYGSWNSYTLRDLHKTTNGTYAYFQLIELEGKQSFYLDNTYLVINFPNHLHLYVWPCGENIHYSSDIAPHTCAYKYQVSKLLMKHFCLLPRHIFSLFVSLHLK